MGQSPEETRSEPLSVPPGGVAQNELNYSSNDVWQQMRHVANRGSSMEPDFPGFTGTGPRHVALQCLCD